MKSLLTTVSATFIFIAGCASVSHNTAELIASHSFSYEKPPSTWEQIHSSTKSIANDEVKISTYFSAWLNENTSSITVLALDLSGYDEKPTARDTTIWGIEEWIGDYLKNICETTHFKILAENERSTKESVVTFEIESEVMCDMKEESDSYTMKFKSYVIDYKENRYRFQFSARSAFYDRDYNAFVELLDSIDLL